MASGSVTPQEETVDLRALFLNALPKEPSISGETPASNEIFVPKSHVRALHPKMHALKDHLLVPFAFEELEERWRCEGTLDRIREKQQAEVGSGHVEPDQQQPWLLPAHLDDGVAGVRDDLETLGVFRRMRDGRIDVPDVYRLGFRLKRKGGIRPAGGRA